MTENVDNMILEHLRHIRSRVDQIGEDVKDLRERMAALEQAMVSVRREIVNTEETDAR